MESIINTTPVVTPKKRTPKGNVSKKDTDLDSLTKKVIIAWDARPFITLIWKEAKDFQQETTAFSESLVNKSSSSKNRPQLSFDLKKCNIAINLGITKIKKQLDIDAKSTDEAKADYAKFGIVHHTNGYRLPANKEKRTLALKQIASALDEFGYTNNTYGNSYFNPLIAEYTSLVDAGASTTQNISNITGNKNLQKENIIKVLNSLINIIKGNYPDTYKTELRTWGFLKESY